jgi:hypothetical protein
MARHFSCSQAGEFPELLRFSNLASMNRRPDSPFSLAEEYQRLDAFGVLPPLAEPDVYGEAISPAAGLLAVWKEWLRQAPKSRRSRAARIHSGLHAAVANGAELTFKLTDRDRTTCENWLGSRAYWWPRGVPKSPCVGIVASRLKRDQRINAPIMTALRLSMTAIDARTERLLASAGTSLYDYAENCAMSLEVPLLRVFTESEQTSEHSSRQWLEQLIRTQAPDTEYQLSLSPDAGPLLRTASTDDDSSVDLLSRPPIRDRILALMSRRLFVLSIRRNGNWWKLLQAGFSDGLWEPGAVRVVVDQGLCGDDVAPELQNQGAVRWFLRTADDSISTAETHDEVTQPVKYSEAGAEKPHRVAKEDALVSELARAKSSSDWLIHWTRAPRGEWAGESREHYLENMVQGDTHNARTAFGTLERIIDASLVRATAGNTRAASEVVCFTETPLAELVTRRVFRQHRGRWDFEPYGIGIRTDVVRSLGGRAVIYGDEATCQCLPEGERPWFQPRHSQTSTSSKAIDWTSEREWRLPTELTLRNVSADDMFVFCATELEAASLRRTCDWRIVSIEQLNRRLHESAGLNE